ncbi:MAG: TSUP family transporter [Selenomonadaceae bacterium]|nr:TSUP family transporter [Selenomonadaceae bacterium]
MEFLIVCPLAFLAGFVDAIAGGGGLISLPAYLIAGLPPHFAIGTNKLSSTMGTALTTFRFAKSGFINWKLAGVCSLVALGASSVGARLTLLLDEKVFSLVLLVILPLTAYYVFKSKDLSPKGAPRGRVEMYLITLLATVVIGVYDGFYGPGTGTFLLLILTGVAHMKLTEANGLTKAINLSTNVAALTVLLFYGKVLLVLGFVAGLFNMLGNYLGTRSFVSGGSTVVRPLIILVLAIFMVKLIIEL